MKCCGAQREDWRREQERSSNTSLDFKYFFLIYLRSIEANKKKHLQKVQTFQSVLCFPQCKMSHAPLVTPYVAHSTGDIVNNLGFDWTQMNPTTSW